MNEGPKEGCRKMNGACHCPVNECFFERAYPLQEALEATKKPPAYDEGSTIWDVELTVRIKVRLDVANTIPEEEIWELAAACIPETCISYSEDLTPHIGEMIQFLDLETCTIETPGNDEVTQLLRYEKDVVPHSTKLTKVRSTTETNS